MIIDAHQHVWDPAVARYDWLTSESAPIDRAIGFDELAPQLREAGVGATVLVQAADNDEDTALMLRTAQAHPQIVGVVAHVPLADPDGVARRLAAWRDNPLIVGVRALIHDMPDPDWILRPDVDRGLTLIDEAGLTFDLVAVLPRHLEHAPVLAARHPGLRIVVDHLAKPPIGLPDREPWWSLIAEAAQAPMVFAKVSGLYSAIADSAAWTTDGIRPFLRHAIDVFGADRLMYGGDWPISVLSGGYARVWGALSGLIGELDDPAREAILGGTARRFYRLDEGLLDRAARA